MKGAVLIAGPTASGKSRVALEIARRIDGVVVNADSMQVYSVLRVLTARPSPADCALVPHRLYGHVHPAHAYSAGAWLRDVKALAQQGLFAERRPVFVGGTGLYFRALTGGLAPMPEIPEEIRARWRDRLAREGAVSLYGELTARDPRAAGTMRENDGQRIVRALEVRDVSGRSILDWQAEPGSSLLDAKTMRCFVIEPDRTTLHERIASRFDGMLEAGAIGEAETFAALDVPSSAPASKAIGLREIRAAIAGEHSMAVAAEKARAATRRYAKRQSTWFRHQLGGEWTRLCDAEELFDGFAQRNET